MFQGRQNFFSALPPVTKNLIIINFLVWLATIVLPKFGINLVEYLGLHYLTAKDFNAVQLVTYMFMHDPGSIGHVFFNMFSVFMFGRTLEMVWGSKRFLTYYMITGFGAGLVQELTWYISLHNEIAQAVSAYGWEQTRMILNGIITIGASGGIRNSSGIRNVISQSPSIYHVHSYSDKGKIFCHLLRCSGTILRYQQFQRRQYCPLRPPWRNVIRIYRYKILA